MTRKPHAGQIRIVVIGAGVRGSHLARQLVSCAQLGQIVGVAEPNEERRYRHSTLDLAKMIENR